MTGDPDLLDDLLRLAAAGGTEVDVAADPVAARPRFTHAPLVLVGVDQAAACLHARLPRRPRMIIVGHEPIVPTAWDLAEPLGAEHVALLPAAEPWLVDRFASSLRLEPPPDGRVLAVLGGRGGAGASTLAGGLAVTAVRTGLRTLLLDADPLGGGLDLVLGWEQVDGLRWPALTEAGGPVDPPALLRALPHRGHLVLLCFARDGLPASPGMVTSWSSSAGPGSSAGAASPVCPVAAPVPLSSSGPVSWSVPADVMAVTMEAARATRDLTVVDLPRHLDDAATVALAAADRAILVVPAELRATAAAARVAATAGLHCPHLSVVVRGPAPGRLKAREIARSLGLPLAGSLRPEQAVCEGLEQGEPPAVDGHGPLAELCQRIIADLTSAGAREQA
ncbi:septum site-determining protein Ssd [Couchioplanes caeruleus]|uniref:septum site-determining protein Ssd n=2 Tax=Couchioplanes caeruleus TaxID=56438 RepID=UPI001FD49F0F|nr:septum site-determining protein Ssd [Couchioplanes caeruleus]